MLDVVRDGVVYLTAFLDAGVVDDAPDEADEDGDDEGSDDEESCD